MTAKASRAFSLGSDLVEFRLDLLRRPAADEVADRLSGFLSRAIVTVRPVSEGGGYAGSEGSRVELLAGLASMSPAFVDIELETAKRQPRLIGSVPTSRLIVSWHDMKATPPTPELEKRAKSAAAYGGVAKIVGTALSSGDAARVLSLYESNDPSRLVSFCMGQLGASSRIGALKRGSPLMYCSLPSEPVAPGQITVTEMRHLMESALS